jgi:cytochrome oxidase assembly protein ShyY1
MVMIPVFISLGMWQLRRLDARQAFNAMIRTNINQSPAGVDQLLHPGVPSDATVTQWRRVTATGHYDPGGQLLVRGFYLDSRLGFRVLTPLVTDKAVLLVVRGWIPAGSTAESTVRGPTPPAGIVTVTGRIRPSAPGRPDGSDIPAGQTNSVDVGHIAAELRQPTYGAYVELTAQVPAATAELTPLPAPEVADGPHLSYAIQWFAFAAIAGGGWVLLIVDEAAGRRRWGGNRQR